MTDEEKLRQIAAFIRERLSPWCRCICRIHPDGTRCKLCGHIHAAKKLEEQGNG